MQMCIHHVGDFQLIILHKPIEKLSFPIIGHSRVNHKRLVSVGIEKNICVLAKIIKGELFYFQHLI